MNEMLKAVFPIIVDLAAKISNSQVHPATLNEYEDLYGNENCTLVECIEVYWSKTSKNIKATLEFTLLLSADRIIYNVADFQYERIEWTDPQCLEKITKILTDAR